MILAFERYYDVLLKNMKILILHYVLMILYEMCTQSKFARSLFSLLLEWVFNDFSFWTLLRCIVEKHENFEKSQKWLNILFCSTSHPGGNQVDGVPPVFT